MTERTGGGYMRKFRFSVLSICLSIVMIFSFAGCKKEESEKEEKELVVITDSQLQSAVETAADYFMEKHPDIRVSIEKPSDYSAEEYSADIKKWNTQMIAGKGPDVYLLSTDYEHTIKEKGMEELLIKNVNKTMQSGVFASLDSFMKKDSFWEKSDYKKEILEAGKYKGKQYVLPLTCQYFVLTDTGANGISNVKTVEDLLKYPVSPSSVSFVRARWIQPAIDYENNKVLFDKEQWGEFANDCYQVFAKEEDEQTEETMNICQVRETGSEIQNCRPLPCLNGKRIASVEQYGAIGMSSENKSEAYEFLMLFLNDEYEKEKGEDVVQIRDQMLSWGVPVLENDKYFQENPRILSSYKELDGAYFPCDVERYINEEFDKITFDGEQDDLKMQYNTLANKIYEKYKMIVEE